MILSHEHRFLFLKTTKTAGSSLHMTLTKYCGPDDIIAPMNPEDERVRASLGYAGPRNCQLPWAEYRWKDYLYRMVGRERNKYHKHITAGELRSKLDPSVWDRYFKFAVVRNPFDYAVSLYFWRHREQQPSTLHFRQWLLRSGRRADRRPLQRRHRGVRLFDLKVRRSPWFASIGTRGRNSGETISHAAPIISGSPSRKTKA